MSGALSISVEDLKLLGRLAGWAPGDYMGKCHKCGAEMVADKRAGHCFVCAVAILRDQAEMAGIYRDIIRRRLDCDKKNFDLTNEMIAALGDEAPAT